MRGEGRSAKNAGPGKGHVGLGRALSKMGFCSRSEAFEMIRAGRVRLKGTLTKNPEAAVRLGKDRIEVDGSAMSSGNKHYVVMNNPQSLVRATDGENEPTDRWWKQAWRVSGRKP